MVKRSHPVIWARHLLTGFDGYQVNPSDGSLTRDDRYAFQALSPDGSRGFLADADQWRLVDLDMEATLARFPQGIETRFTWSPDSAYFVVLSPERVLMLYDRDGQVIDSLIALGPDRRLWNLSWLAGESSGLLFSLYDPYQGRNPLYTADFQTRVITDHCVELVPYHDGQHESAAIGSADGAWIALIASDQPDRVQLLGESGRYDLIPYVGGFLGWSDP